ncbi:MAG TPA: FAD-dependent monooxygenase [Acidobacteriaceae bacterium]|nr:FAD-dependent monooxygenase [Acidobacteriaceae bacterium]
MSTGLSSSAVDVMIVGGGPAGAAAAVLLAREGRRVVVIEKTSGAHHKVCGEFLSHEALLYLERLGVDLAAIGAVPIRRLLLAAETRIAECNLPFAAMSLTRRALDEALLELATRAGATVLRGCRVDALERSGGIWRARLSDGEMCSGTSAFLATGKHDVGSHPRPAGRQNDLVAFKMYYRMPTVQRAAIARHVELVVFPGGYAGLQLVEDGAANLCLLVRRSRLRACGGQWDGLLAHILRNSRFLAELLEGAEPLMEKPLAASSLPYGLLRRRSPDEIWRLGDQAAVIPSFSGDGISIALHSSHLAAQVYLAGGDADAYQRRLAGELNRSVSVATAISRSVVASPQLAQFARLCPLLLRPIASGTRVPAHALFEGVGK